VVAVALAFSSVSSSAVALDRFLVQSGSSNGQLVDPFNSVRAAVLSDDALKLGNILDDDDDDDDDDN